MLRRFLACLALLTGLAAAGTPAHAAVTMAMASRMEQSVSRDQAPRGQVRVSAMRELPGYDRRADIRLDGRNLAAPRTPSVRIGSDRSRE